MTLTIYQKGYQQIEQQPPPLEMHKFLTKLLKKHTYPHFHKEHQLNNPLNIKFMNLTLKYQKTHCTKKSHSHTSIMQPSMEIKEVPSPPCSNNLKLCSPIFITLQISTPHKTQVEELALTTFYHSPQK